MSMPSSFRDSETYFDTVIEFLCSYSWIYREANVACIPSINIMPLEFKKYFLEISNEKLNAFPYIHENISDYPSELCSFRQQLSILTPNLNSPKTFDVMRNNRNHKGLSTKKTQEIKQLAAHIHDHCANTQVLVDLGAGLGYLSHALYGLKPDCLILGLEADMARVEQARQRCLRCLPPDAINSIRYLQKFVSFDSGSYIDEQTSELARNNGSLDRKTISIIGLHACGDLSINAMHLFLKMPRVQCLHIMPCCYHKLEVVNHGRDSDAKSFTNFPLSAALGKSVKKSFKNPFLNRPFLRLACQRSTSNWWRDCTEGAHKEHGYRMYMRALAEAILNSTEFVKPRKSRFPVASYPIDFFEIKRRFQLFSKESGASVEWQPSHENMFFEISTMYTDQEGSMLVEGLTCLQAAMQKLCENVVLFDRLCFLKEAAENQKLTVQVRYETLFDEKISPRCQVLFAEKLF
ncbi:methyltransferase-like protein 25B isoform X2 [Drosophila gunungcola]|nr:methyltransferase-like protein 25B isoform X2 [Drosophila gunungcola]